jgi:hypothetical protein
LFGIGALWGQRSDITGVGPDQFGVLQENSIDFSFELKELYSQLSFPIDIARGKGKITGKAKIARIFGALYADLFFGSTYTTSSVPTVSENEAHVVSTTITVSNSGFLSDLGIYYNTPGNLRFSSVTGAPSAVGQYSVAAGIYTFFSGDVGANVNISYSYANVGSTGKEIVITNNFMGYTPTWSGTFYSQKATQGSSGQLTLLLNECVSSKLSFPSKSDDYNIPDFDYMAFSPASGNIGTLSTTE